MEILSVYAKEKQRYCSELEKVHCTVLEIIAKSWEMKIMLGIWVGIATAKDENRKFGRRKMWRLTLRTEARQCD